MQSRVSQRQTKTKQNRAETTEEEAILAAGVCVRENKIYLEIRSLRSINLFISHKTVNVTLNS